MFQVSIRHDTDVTVYLPVGRMYSEGEGGS